MQNLPPGFGAIPVKILTSAVTKSSQVIHAPSKTESFNSNTSLEEAMAVSPAVDKHHAPNDPNFRPLNRSRPPTPPIQGEHLAPMRTTRRMLRLPGDSDLSTTASAAPSSSSRLPSSHTAKGPDGTRGFRAGRGKPLPIPGKIQGPGSSPPLGASLDPLLLKLQEQLAEEKKKREEGEEGATRLRRELEEARGEAEALRRQLAAATAGKDEGEGDEEEDEGSLVAEVARLQEQLSKARDEIGGRGHRHMGIPRSFSRESSHLVPPGEAGSVLSSPVAAPEPQTVGSSEPLNGEADGDRALGSGERLNREAEALREEALKQLGFRVQQAEGIANLLMRELQEARSASAVQLAAIEDLKRQLAERDATRVQGGPQGQDPSGGNQPRFDWEKAFGFQKSEPLIGQKPPSPPMPQPPMALNPYGHRQQLQQLEPWNTFPSPQNAAYHGLPNGDVSFRGEPPQWATQPPRAQFPSAPPHHLMPNADMAFLQPPRQQYPAQYAFQEPSRNLPAPTQSLSGVPSGFIPTSVLLSSSTNEKATIGRRSASTGLVPPIGPPLPTTFDPAIVGVGLGASPRLLGGWNENGLASGRESDRGWNEEYIVMRGM